MSISGNTLVLVLSALFVISCKHDMEERPKPTTGTLRLAWGYHWGEPDFMLNMTYMDDFGNAIVFDTVRYFACDIGFKHGNDVVASYPHACLLLSAEEEGVVELGEAAPTDIDSISVTLGLESDMNHGDPASASPPLNDGTMHWGSNAADGYYFLQLTGRVDDDGDGIVDGYDPRFAYRCATDALLRSFTKAAPLVLVAGGVNGPHMHLHVDELMEGIDVLNNPTAVGNEPINIQLMDRMEDVIEME
jgi:hypothetical protein